MPRRTPRSGTIEWLLRTSGLFTAPAPDTPPGVGPDAAPLDAALFAIPFDEPARSDRRVPRHVLAHALQLALSVELFGRVPEAAQYAREQRAAGRSIVLDHGAIRTVAWPTASPVPPGVAQVTRVLQPLGWSHRSTYPLPRLRMTGRSFAHDDLPEELGQWFVSELHPDDFSVEFRHAVERVLGTAADPVGAATRSMLDELSTERSLPVDDGPPLLTALMSCFTRLHDEPIDRDYDILLAESAEMAWIATEGTAFNHATDRVDDVAVVAEQQRALGRSIKDAVEVSASGRVRQTAFRAATVKCTMRTPEGTAVDRQVPGSFFEFIDRAPLADGTLDLEFDTSNAQGIFAMTTPATPGTAPAPPRPAAPTAAADRVVPRPNTTFKPRRRALSAARQADLVRWLDRWGLGETGPPLVWDEVFAGLPVVLEIGFGGGEATIEMATARPDRAVIGIDVHTPGVVAVLEAIERDGLDHVRVVHGDALRFLTRVAPRSLAGVRIFFPDPWPKPRHHQRRLVRDDVVAVLVDRLDVGGELHLATDIAHYASAMETACAADARLAGGMIERPAWRPMTRFERRGIDEGRPAVDLLYTRID